jgi:hypothetical protein
VWHFLGENNMPYERPIILAWAVTAMSFIHWVFLIGTIILLIDAHARYKEYLGLRNKKWCPRTARKLGKSWCGRGVALYIWPSRAKPFYYELGYRWWHILPDGAPIVFFKWKFWLKVFGLNKTL